ncbi:MAG: HlyD family efflux transporter periplasmic adaptor subunit [Spongiibacteraceae bacterium]|nr:HlyD family efflux transporter periplasmic adaptor subunit [Spongiibacteraceae bacterium]
MRSHNKFILEHFLQKPRAGFLAVLIGILISAAVLLTAPEHTAQKIEEKVWPISVMDVVLEPLSPQLKLFGRVNTPHKVELSAAIHATITQVFVNEGQIVSKGDLLVELDDSDAKLALAEHAAGVLDAQAQLATLEIQQQSDLTMLKHQEELNTLTQAKLKRHQTLALDQLVSASSVDDYQRETRQQAIELERQRATVKNHPNQLIAAKAQLQRAQALLGKAQLDVERTRIYAPFDGAITKRLVAAGDRVEIGRGLIKLYDTAAMEVRAAIPAHHLPKLHAALAQNQALIANAQINQQAYLLRLESLSAEVNTTRSAVDGLFSFQQMHYPPTLGQVVNLQLALPETSGLVAVPAQAVYDSQRVYLVEEERLLAVDINIVGEMENTQGQFRLLIQADAFKLGQLLMTSQLAAASTELKVSFNKPKTASK